MKYDPEDEDLFKSRKWRIHRSSGYLCAKINGKFVYFHRAVLGFPNGIVDHINRNKLDNRKKNLRVVCRHINAVNRDIQKNNTSGYRGVSFLKKNKVWMSCITVNKKRHYLGCYSTAKQAAVAYNLAAKKFFGDNAVLNHI